MSYTMHEAVQFIEENDVKFIRLAFCDIFGTQKNLSIMPGELARAFSSGIPFDASAFYGFASVDDSDLLLLPDPATLNILPWRPSQGRVVRFYCGIRHPDGRRFSWDGRHILSQAVARARDKDLVCAFGTECEFYLFERDENGVPTAIPHDHASYFDIAPLDKGENVRRQICLTLEEMGIQPECSHHEHGPGQNEIDFKCSHALEAADNFVTFKSVVKTIAAANGLFASFLPKPLSGKPGNGLHINLSLFQNGENIFASTPTLRNHVAESFIAGLLKRAAEITAFLNPLTNSYARFGEFEAPKYLSWSHQNRSALIRFSAAADESSRIELRSPDSALNPYLAFALLLHAGLDGMEQNLEPPAPCRENLFAAPHEVLHGYAALPNTLQESITLAGHSDFVSSVLPAPITQSYFAAKQAEWDRYTAEESPQSAEFSMYFERY